MFVADRSENFAEHHAALEPAFGEDPQPYMRLGCVYQSFQSRFRAFLSGLLGRGGRATHSTLSNVRPTGLNGK